ncbi:MAG: DNA polymerase IV [Waddliaceae bacterium]
MRKIIHIDMDAFFAAIEQRDNPALRGKPVIVGGDPHRRGVVATCSYEARKFGVHSAMSTRMAYQLCPQGIFIRPRFDVYQEVSQQIRNIFYQYTDLVEPLSLDEAYLDVTANKKNEPSATRLAQRIKEQIRKETGLTASAGVSFNKCLAKVASDWKKPDGLTVIPPKEAEAFIEQLPIRKFHGIGKVTEKKMQQMGVYTGRDLRKMDRSVLLEAFGKIGDFFFRMSHCQDDRPVNPTRVRRSIGKETTFPTNRVDRAVLIETLEELADEVSERLKEHQMKARTLCLKIRYDDFTTITRRITAAEPFQDSVFMITVLLPLLDKTEAGKRPVRLIGISVSNLE